MRRARYYRVLVQLSLLAACAGCGDSEYEIASRVAIDHLQERISRWERRGPDDMPQTELRLGKEFTRPADKAVLDVLLSEGPDSLRSPVMLWSVIAPRPISESTHPQKNTNREKLFFGEWLEVGSRATGVFFVMQDGGVIEFPNVLKPDCHEFVELDRINNPHRFMALVLTEANNTPRPSFIELDRDQYNTIVAQRAVCRFGLILDDSTRTETGPVAYQADYDFSPGPE